MSSLFITGLIQLLESSLNRLMRQDPHFLRSLNTVASGKRLRVVCESATTGRESWQLTVIITPEKLYLHSNNFDTADATIRGSRKALAGLLTSADPASALHHPDLHLEGDVHLIQSVHKTISDTDTRWDDVLGPWLRPFVGDSGAALGTAAVNSSVEFMQNSAQSMRLNLKDYLQEESGLLPTRSEVQIANERLDALRLRLDRLGARMSQLRQHVTN